MKKSKMKNTKMSIKKNEPALIITQIFILFYRWVKKMLKYLVLSLFACPTLGRKEARKEGSSVFFAFALFPPMITSVLATVLLMNASFLELLGKSNAARFHYIFWTTFIIILIPNLCSAFYEIYLHTKDNLHEADKDKQ